MPTYEYACRTCGEHLEVVQSFRDGPLTECPNCSGDLRKVFSAAGLIFKGSGWHIKDYGSSSARTTSAGEGASNATSSEGSSGESAGDRSSDSGGDGKAASKTSDSKSNSTDDKKSA